MKHFFLVCSLAAVTGCSLYESDGRKFLESNAFGYAGVGAQANLQGCNRPENQTNWVLMSQDDRAELYSAESETYQMRVALKDNSNFNCDFSFKSAREMFDKTNEAEDLTVHQLNSQPQTPPKTR